MTTEPFAPFGSPLEARGAILRVLMRDAATVPAFIQAKLEAALNGDSFTALIGALEGLYASRAALSADSWTDLARVAQAVVAGSFGDAGKNGRAQAILFVARRERGEAVALPDGFSDPAIDTAWVEPPAEEPA